MTGQHNMNLLRVPNAGADQEYVNKIENLRAKAQHIENMKVVRPDIEKKSKSRIDDKSAKVALKSLPGMSDDVEGQIRQYLRGGRKRRNTRRKRGRSRGRSRRVKTRGKRTRNRRGSRGKSRRGSRGRSRRGKR